MEQIIDINLLYDFKSQNASYFRKHWQWHKNHPGLLLLEAFSFLLLELNYQWSENNGVILKDFNDQLFYLAQQKRCKIKLDEALKACFQEIDEVYVIWDQALPIYDLKVIFHPHRVVPLKTLKEQIENYRKLGEGLGALMVMQPEPFTIHLEVETKEVEQQEEVMKSLVLQFQKTLKKRSREKPLSVLNLNVLYELLSQMETIATYDQVTFKSELSFVSSLSCDDNTFLFWDIEGSTIRFWDDYSEDFGQEKHLTPVSFLDNKVNLVVEDKEENPPWEMIDKIVSLSQLLPESVKHFYQENMGEADFQTFVYWLDALVDENYQLQKKWKINLDWSAEHIGNSTLNFILEMLGWEWDEKWQLKKEKSFKLNDFKRFFIHHVAFQSPQLSLANRVQNENNPLVKLSHYFYPGTAPVFFMVDAIALRPQNEEFHHRGVICYKQEELEMIHARTKTEVKQFYTDLFVYKEAVKWEVMIDENMLFYVELYYQDYAVFNSKTRSKSLIDTYLLKEELEQAWQIDLNKFQWEEKLAEENFTISLEDMYTDVFVWINGDEVSEAEAKNIVNLLKAYMPFYLNMNAKTTNKKEFEEVLVNWKHGQLSFKDFLKWKRGN